MIDLKKYTDQDFLFFDGAFGTMLQKNNVLELGENPPVLNITKSGAITDIHNAYADAGSNVITTNTFEANRYKLKDSGYSVAEVVEKAVENAKNSRAEYVALDIGPTGKLIEPSGDMAFEEAYEIFKEIIEAGQGADLIILETFSDLLEMKAALLAAKENSDLPVICSMTFTDDGRTFTGTDPETAARTLEALGADAVGVNCSLGPEELIPVVQNITQNVNIPVIVQANAGLPQVEDSQTVYKISPEDYAESVLKMAEAGASIIGGCCGTTPEYIKTVREKLSGTKPKKRVNEKVGVLTSPVKTVHLQGLRTIGERINPTGKPVLKEALRTHQLDRLYAEGLKQEQEGADILDVNVGLPEIDEEEVLKEVVLKLSALSKLPVQVDSSKPEALEKALRVYPGLASINSVNGSNESLESVLPLAQKYGSTVIGLTLDENGIPDTAEGRFEIAKRIVEEAEKYGIGRERIIIDGLVLTASAQQDQVQTTLDTIRRIREELGVHTTLGISNISFGLPERETFNSVFLAMALNAGVDVPIINPGSKKIRDVLSVYRVIDGEDLNSEEYLKEHTGTEEKPVETTGEGNLEDFILSGASESAAAKTRELLHEMTPNDIVNQYFVPALTKVGKAFEEGSIFLPQLMQSAGAVQNSFRVLQENQHAEKIVSKGKVLLATVQGDIHDIGKNIVKLMLENYGYTVFDLGSDVDPDRIIETIEKEDIDLVGLSALMTTTVESMQETIERIKALDKDIRIMVGGAVLTENYASMIGADDYGRDAQMSVAIAQKHFEEKGEKND